MSLQTSYSDNAGLKMIIFSFDESLDILNGTAHNQSVITLEGSGCDNRKKHYKLCKESTAL